MRWVRGWRAFRGRLRAGDWVEVRSRDEILATLTGGRLDGLPLMPQMLAMSGRRFQVDARAHKTCDTVDRTGGRRMKDAVHLSGPRCDGAAYDGCGAACSIFWKQAWLRRVDGPRAGGDPVPVSVGRRTAAEDAVWAATRAPGSTKEDPTYVCQATTLPEFTSPLPWWDVRQYLEDVSSGNVSPRMLLNGAAYVAFYKAYRVSWRVRLQPTLVRLYDRFQQAIGGVPFPRRVGRVPQGQATPRVALGLEAGDVVTVKSLDDVMATLDGANKNRGLYFDAEEVPYCGKQMTVRGRVDKIIDERTGKMIPIGGNTVILEDAYCLGRYSDRRMLCPRKIYPFWREAWLTRDAAGGSG